MIFLTMLNLYLIYNMKWHKNMFRPSVRTEIIMLSCKRTSTHMHNVLQKKKKKKKKTEKFLCILVYMNDKGC